MSNTKIFLVEDHELVRKGVRSIIDSEPSIAIIGEYDRAQKAIDALAEGNIPDIILMDISMPQMTGLDASKVIGENIANAPSLEKGITEAYRKLSGKQPKPKELEILLSLQAEEKKKFEAQPEKMKGWIESGEYQVSSKLDSSLIASCAVVASVIMNGDVSITKR